MNDRTATIGDSTRSLLAGVVDAAREPLSTIALRRREVVYAGVGLVLVGLLAYMPHIVRGGWYLDDWIDVARMRAAHGPLGVFDAMSEYTYRPGLALSLSAFYGIAGTDPSAYLAIGALLAGIQSWLLYLVLRLCRLRPIVALSVAAIFAVLPCIDATRLWMAAFPTQVAGSLYLLGVIVAMRGLAARGRQAVAWHGGAALLFLASILTYELIAGVVAVTWLLYVVRTGPRPALKRLPVDLTAIAIGFAIISSQAADERGATISLGFFRERAQQILDAGWPVFRELLPADHVSAGAIGLLVLLPGMLGSGIAIGRRDETSRGIAAWAWMAALGVVFALAGLVMLLPADSYFVPRPSGLGDRTGAFAAFGAIPLLLALIVLALGGLGMLVHRPRLGAWIAVVAVAVTGVNLGVRELRHQSPWTESWREQKEIVAVVGAAMGGRPPADAAIISFRHTTFIEPADVSVFAYSWDLRGALWETYRLPDIAAHPWDEEARCRRAGMAFLDQPGPPSGSEPYGYDKLYFVDVYTQTAMRIRNKAACRAAVAKLTGPLPSLASSP